MSGNFVWQERFNIGVDVIDKEHKKLFKIVNKLLAYGEDEKKREWVCQEGVKYFKEHAITHFADEEAYMESIRYSDLEMHRRIHNDFRQKTLPALEKELEGENYSLDSVSHFLGVCVGWLVGHTLTEDHAIAGKAKSKWAKLLAMEEQESLKQMIISLIYDLFRVNARVISESYGGEKFGNGIYYRLIHSNQKGEKWETILVFEEKLLLNTIGQMIDDKPKKLNMMIMDAARYTAKQFVKRIMEPFSKDGLYEMKKENLLTYEQFQKVFVREDVQVSLLFDTDEGYFAYCIIAPHLAQEKVGTAIRADNAIDEINKYLEQNRQTKKAQEKKKKILIADDSEVVLQSMKQLLEKDYEITMAKSGLSAIRCITLDMPDLLLLDYEMPVCDGKQVLEMIRAEEEFADLPVIFLTGRRDTESVKKVMALKPAGYLLKDLQPADIKKTIDTYLKEKSKG